MDNRRYWLNNFKFLDTYLGISISFCENTDEYFSQKSLVISSYVI